MSDQPAMSEMRLWLSIIGAAAVVIGVELFVWFYPSICVAAHLEERCR